MPRAPAIISISSMSIPSTLIRATLSTIHKELRQLEHWLITLSSESAEKGVPQDIPVESLSVKMDRILQHYESQQLALNHIVDRLDILEGNDEDPWLDSSSCLGNIVVDPLEPMYIVRKSENTDSVAKAVPVDNVVNVVPVENVVHAVNVAPVENAVHVVHEAPVDNVVNVVPVENVVADDIPAINAPPSIIAVPSNPPQEEEPEEEPEDGVELEELVYKGTNYYKDPSEGFIYGMDEEGQPTDQPIGIWKEKSQTIAFYRTQPK